MIRVLWAAEYAAQLQEMYGRSDREGSATMGAGTGLRLFAPRGEKRRLTSGEDLRMGPAVRRANIVEGMRPLA